MWKIPVFSVLLVGGVVLSQVLPALMGPNYGILREWAEFLTMVGLGFIMIHVGYEFELDKRRLASYGWDYVVAMTTAAFPWIFAAGYFVWVMMPRELWSSWDAWKEVLIAARFAAPTASGVLFAMLAAAGLSVTWMFRKTRILVIFDDLDTVLLMIPLKIIFVGWAAQLGVIVVVMVVLLWIAWHWLHRVAIPVTWPWVLGYAVVIAAVSEAIYLGSKAIDQRIPIHLEVLLPAFVLGCIMKRPEGTDPHRDDARLGHQEGPEWATEQLVATIVSMVFMLLVGLSMPPLFAGVTAKEFTQGEQTITASMAPIGLGALALHVVLVTVLINIGKLFPAFCYRREAHWRERLAVAIAMCPRGEVGAGIILLSLQYGIGGPIVSVAMLSLALNLVLTPLFISTVIYLLKEVPRTPTALPEPEVSLTSG